MERLQTYSWPGNVRELENTIERAINFTSSGQITLQDLPEHIGIEKDRPAYKKPVAVDPSAEPDRPAAEYEELIRLLREYRGNVRAIAQVKGIPLSTLYGKLNRYHLRAKDYKTL